MSGSRNLSSTPRSASWGRARAQPLATQPVLDALERAFPAIRSAYMDEKLRGIAADADTQAARYRDEAQKLRDREAERRWKGEPLDEGEVRRIASFLKSYNEMT